MNIEGLLQKISDELKPVVVSMHNTISNLTEENNRLRRQLFGSSAEKHVAQEVILPKDCLFNEAEVIDDFVGPPLPPDAVKTEPLEPKKRRTRSPLSGGRQPLPENLQRHRIVHDLDHEQKFCPNDGAALVLIGEETVETLGFTPGTFHVDEHVYPKYACQECQQHIAQQQATPSALPQTQCSPTLLAHIIVCKYLFAMPLYRQETQYEQMGIELSRTSMARWVIKSVEILKPLLSLLKQSIIKKSAIHADETTFQVLKEPKKAAESKSYLWTLCTAEHDPPAVYYEYFDSRSGDAALSLLHGFAGLLHVDGYDGYNCVFKNPNVIRIGCWAHVRRKFDVAKKDGAATGKTLAGDFLTRIQELFLLERKWLDLSADDRLTQRKLHAQPVVTGIRALLDEYSAKVTPKSKLGMAMSYLESQWNTLKVFLTQGHAALSNNRMENYIRPFAIGRKNWLFAETVSGAHASAALYSLIITAQANGLNLHTYLVSLFTELPVILAHTSEADLEPYLPWIWKQTHKA